MTAESFLVYVPILTVIIAFLSLLHKYREEKRCLTKEVSQYKLKNIYSPLFQMLENYLYKKIDIETAKTFALEFQNIINDHYEYLDPVFVSQLKIFIEKADKNLIAQTSFDNICKVVDIEFEANKKILHLPKRGIFLKYFLHQLPKDQYESVSYFIKVIMNFITGIILISLLVVIAQLIKILFSFKVLFSF